MGPSLSLDLAPLVVIAQVQRVEERNFVLADLVPKQAPRRPVSVARHAEAACKISQPRDDDERHVMLTLAPADAPYLVIGDEHRVRPDPVLVKAALNRAAHGKQIR